MGLTWGRIGRLRPLAIAVAAIPVFAAGGESVAATLGKSYFFASRDACVSSGAFRKKECDAAFANAEVELRDRAPGFASRAECRLKFHYCEARRVEPPSGDENDAVAYSPLALGVEMTLGPRGAEAAPVLAVETPQSLFPRFPVSREYVSRQREPRQDEALAYNAILPADRFGPFPRTSASGALARFVSPAPPAETAAPLDIASHEETPQERRARLRNAPFVE